MQAIKRPLWEDRKKRCLSFFVSHNKCCCVAMRQEMQLVQKKPFSLYHQQPTKPVVYVCMLENECVVIFANSSSIQNSKRLSVLERATSKETDERIFMLLLLKSCFFPLSQALVNYNAGICNRGRKEEERTNERILKSWKVFPPLPKATAKIEREHTFFLLLSKFSFLYLCHCWLGRSFSPLFFGLVLIIV